MIKKTPKKEKNKKYFSAIGRRKTAIARVRLFNTKEKQGEDFLVNEKSLKEYFPINEMQEVILSPLKEANCLDLFNFSVKVKGGGVSAQAGAIRHGISKALILFDSELRKKLKKLGFLTRDPRMRERKKFGLKRARRAPQWSKR